MTIEEILTMSDDTRRKLTQKELSSMVSYTAKKLNKRLGNLAKHPDVADYALKNVQETGGRFGAKGKTYNQLQKELTRMRNFYNAKTSTVAGARAVAKQRDELVFGATKETAKRASKLTPEKRTALTKKIFKAYRKFEEMHPSLRGHGSEKYIGQIGRVKTEKRRTSEAKLIEEAEKLFKEEYGTEQIARKEMESDIWTDLGM